MRKGFLQPRPFEQTGRNAFGRRPQSYRSREAPKLAATKVPCARGCGKWIGPNPTNECRLCYERRIAEQKAARRIEPQRAQPTVYELRTITVDGEEYDVVGDGTGSWFPEPRSITDTPKNLGCSLLDSSRVVR